MTRIALILLASLAVWSPERTPVRRGPPLICFPIEIGSAESLPKAWEWRSESRPSTDVVISETLRVLETSDDAVVHMETLRRAYVCLQSRPEGGMAGHDPPSPNVARLGACLKDTALVSAVPDVTGASANTRREAFAWFDLGYLIAIKENGLHGRDLVRDLSCHRFLERAAALAPNDAALQFGVAFGQIHNYIGAPGATDPQTPLWHRLGWKHLATAMDLTTDAASLVAKNICALFAQQGPYGPPTTFEELRRRIAAESRPR
jgi:hypothetical protein